MRYLSNCVQGGVGYEKPTRGQRAVGACIVLETKGLTSPTAPHCGHAAPPDHMLLAPFFNISLPNKIGKRERQEINERNSSKDKHLSIKTKQKNEMGTPLNTWEGG
ncbi:hypothetical protein V6N13_127933 [Hibiscus sabdariffa]|uniref:Uncharacterized protein n=2 Tax=Hibiscus sabdariffa TaxID=183260 RepID=A0ABR2AEN9_9ROSI